MPNPTPKVNAMLICDTIITDKMTGKKSLIGIFENLTAARLPVTGAAALPPPSPRGSRSRYAKTSRDNEASEVRHDRPSAARAAVQ